MRGAPALLELRLCPRPRGLRLNLLSRANPTHEPSCLLQLSTALAGASVGLGRAFRRSPEAQLLVAQLLRRYLVVLGSPGITLTLRGIFSGFTLFWRKLNTPLHELYVHPVTGELVADIALTGLFGRRLPRQPVLHRYLTERAVADFDPSTLEAAEAALMAFFARLGRSNAVLPRVYWRYRLSWASVRRLAPALHSRVRRPRARSLNRRRAKRIVAATGHRFWAAVPCSEASHGRFGGRLPAAAA